MATTNQTTKQTTKYDEEAKKRVEEHNKLVNDQTKQQIDKINSDTDASISKMQKETDDKIQETNDDYLDIIKSADVQKELDLRNIRETRANMGLSRSGISATEQTAAILSAGNKTAEALRQKQKAIDSLNKSLLEFKETAESERQGKVMSIEQNRDTAIYNNTEKWNTWAFDNNQADEEARETNLLNMLNSGEIDDATYQLAKTSGWTPVEARQYYAPTKAEKDHKDTLAQWRDSGFISQDVYDKAVKENWSLDQVRSAQAKEIEADEKEAEDKVRNDTLTQWLGNGTISVALYNKANKENLSLDKVIHLQAQENQKNAKLAAQSQAASAQDEANQKAENERESKLYSAWKDNKITDDVYSRASRVGWNVEQAIRLNSIYEAVATGSDRTSQNSILMRHILNRNLTIEESKGIMYLLGYTQQDVDELTREIKKMF